MTTSEIQKQLKRVSDQVAAAITALSDDQLDIGIGSSTPVATRWNASQHLAHLYLSSQPVNKAMTIPKEILEQKFGTRNRDEFDFDDLMNLYDKKLAQGALKAPAQFSPDSIPSNQRAAYLDKYENEMEMHIKHLNEWSDEDLSTYVLPHPAIGTITMREMMLFTVIHNLHHLSAIQSIMV